VASNKAIHAASGEEIGMSYVTAMIATIALFVCIAASIKFVVDAYTRRKIVNSHATEEMVRTLLQADEQARRLASLKWGLVLTAMGLAAGAIQVLGIQFDTPAAIGLVCGSAGVALLLYHYLSVRGGAGQ
jgi:hypothetical protein